MMNAAPSSMPLRLHPPLLSPTSPPPPNRPAGAGALGAGQVDEQRLRLARGQAGDGFAVQADRESAQGGDRQLLTHLLLISARTEVAHGYPEQQSARTHPDGERAPMLCQCLPPRR